MQKQNLINHLPSGMYYAGFPFGVELKLPDYVRQLLISNPVFLIKKVELMKLNKKQVCP